MVQQLDSRATAAQVLLLLRDRNVPREVLARLWRDPNWLRHPAIRGALTLHPAVPLAVAQRLLPRLTWKALCDVVNAPQVDVLLRRRADQLLCRRVEALTEGEKISLARRAGPTVLRRLGTQVEQRVLEALLQNPRLGEVEAAVVAASECAPAALLTRLSCHPVWGPRLAIRLALLANPRTPIHVSLSLLQRIPRNALHRISKDVKVPRIVRVGAMRLREGSAAASG